MFIHMPRDQHTAHLVDLNIQALQKLVRPASLRASMTTCHVLVLIHPLGWATVVTWRLATAWLLAPVGEETAYCMFAPLLSWLQVQHDRGPDAFAQPTDGGRVGDVNDNSRMMSAALSISRRNYNLLAGSKLLGYGLQGVATAEVKVYPQAVTAPWLQHKLGLEEGAARKVHEKFR
jgi:hypothetical protein